MNETFVYLEGPSDKLGLEKLLAGPLAAASRKGYAFFFFELGGKKPLLNKGPAKAIAILRNRPKSRVFLVPDLYPPNTPFDHKTFEQLKAETESRFNAEIKRQRLDTGLARRFKVHCFQYDLEVLLLAAEKPLQSRLGSTTLTVKWKKPRACSFFNRACPFWRVYLLDYGALNLQKTRDHHERRPLKL